MEKVAKCSFLKRAFVLLPLLLVCACTTTIKPVGSMPIASSSLRAEKDTDQQHKLEAMKPAELIAEGQTQLDAGDFQLARIYFLKALDKTPTSAEAFVGLGEIWQKTGVPQKARMAYEKALEVRPDFIPALLATVGLAGSRVNSRRRKTSFPVRWPWNPRMSRPLRNWH